MATQQNVNCQGFTRMFWDKQRTIFLRSRWIFAAKPVCKSRCFPLLARLLPVAPLRSQSTPKPRIAHTTKPLAWP